MSQSARLRRARSRRAAGAALLCATMGVLAGCGGDDPVAPEPLAATSPTVSATPSPAAPTLPPAARGTSKQAAVAFVKHYIDVLNYTAQSLDATGLASLSSPSCAACSGIADRVREIKANGGRIEEGVWTAIEVTPQDPWSSDRRQINVVIEADDQRLFEDADSPAVVYTGGRTLYTFEVTSRSQNHWTVLRIFGGG